MSSRVVGGTQAGATRDRVRADILAGVWAPGEKLALQALAERYGTSSTVVREALSRLAGEKFVVLTPNVGFSVPQLDLQAFRDLTEVRCMTDGLATKLAIERGDLAWESNVVSAHHRLLRTSRRDSLREWIEMHRRFHDVIISASGVEVLQDLSRSLFDSTELYRRWMGQAELATEEHLAERDHEHNVLVEALLQRDTDLAVATTRAHYEAALQLIDESATQP